jgi:hypothetical protein
MMWLVELWEALAELLDDDAAFDGALEQMVPSDLRLHPVGENDHREHDREQDDDHGPHDRLPAAQVDRSSGGEAGAG